MADGGNHDPSFVTLVVAGVFAVLANLAGPVFSFLANRKAKKHEHRRTERDPREKKGSKSAD